MTTIKAIAVPSQTVLEIRRKISALEAVVGQAPQIDFRLKHTFAPGVYCREIFIPAGSVVIGKIHRLRRLRSKSFCICRIDKGTETYLLYLL